MTETTDMALHTPTGDTAHLPAAGTFALDPAHTSVEFVARHLMIAKVRGRFTDFTGSITVTDDPLHSSAEATIRTASINTCSEQRDAHLRSADFFDAEPYPTMTYRSTTLLTIHGCRLSVLGELTIRDVTRPVQLDVELNGVVTDPWGQERIALTATTQLDRRDFGLTWNAPMDGGGLMIGNTVTIQIEAEAVRQS